MKDEIKSPVSWLIMHHNNNGVITLKHLQQAREMESEMVATIMKLLREEK
jgi:hypothetical protein